MKKFGKVVVEYSKGQTLHCTIDDVNVSFIYYPNNLVKPLVKDSKIEGLYYASIEDIAVMKLAAIASRGAKKDFYDLYYICKYQNISLIDIFKNMEIKFENKKYPMIHIITSLTYFEDADVESDLNMLVEISYNEVKEFFTNNQKDIFKKLI